jgi:SAM-dependent methyltransferase
VSEVAKVFDRAASVYEEWYRERIGAQVLAAELRGLRVLLPEKGLGAEVGAGTGIFAERLSIGCRGVVCVDPSPGMLSKAAHKGLTTVMAVAEAIPFRSEVLDFAYFVTVFEFLADPLEALMSVRGTLKTGAPLVTLTINRGSPWGKLYREKAEEGDPIFRQSRLYEMDEVGALHAKAGYEYREALSTLTNPPSAEDIGTELVPANPDNGVVLIKSVKKS